jgi:class 3 adenylate cyclase
MLCFCSPGDILVSEAVRAELVNKPNIEITFVKEVQLKNVSGPRKIYKAKVEEGKLDVAIAGTTGRSRFPRFYLLFS